MTCSPMWREQVGSGSAHRQHRMFQSRGVHIGDPGVSQVGKLSLAADSRGHGLGRRPLPRDDGIATDMREQVGLCPVLL